MNTLRRLILVALMPLVLAWIPPTAAAPAAKPWPLWEAHDADSRQAIDHSAWSEWLSRMVETATDGINRVAYHRVGDADRAALRNYIDALSAIEISRYNRGEQRAYWINLYNALTVDVVLEHYPLESIRDISSGFFSSGPWKLDLVEVENRVLSLDDIEHRILRPIWRDPRIHYAVNCASLGCPNLQREAFTVENAESLMDRSAREFVNHNRGARVNDGKLEVSSIYDWFEDDFGGNDAGVIEHLRRYADAELESRLAGIERVSDDSYDWRLNGAPGS